MPFSLPIGNWIERDNLVRGSRAGAPSPCPPGLSLLEVPFIRRSRTSSVDCDPSSDKRATSFVDGKGCLAGVYSEWTTESESTTTAATETSPQIVRMRRLWAVRYWEYSMKHGEHVPMWSIRLAVS